MLGLLYITVICGILLGGIATSNAYAADYFWAIKLFYFVYGAVGFPITLCMAAYHKPYWVSGLIPLKSLVPRKVPTATAAPTPVPTAAPTAPPTSAQGLLNKAASLFGLSGGGSDDMAALQPSAPGSATIVLPTSIPSLSLTDKLFGFVLVDPKNPTAAQKSSQNILRILSIVELVLLGAVGIYYGVDKLILKNRL